MTTPCHRCGRDSGAEAIWPTDYPVICEACRIALDEFDGGPTQCLRTLATYVGTFRPGEPSLRHAPRIVRVFCHRCQIEHQMGWPPLRRCPTCGELWSCWTAGHDFGSKDQDDDDGITLCDDESSN